MTYRNAHLQRAVAPGKVLIFLLDEIVKPIFQAIRMRYKLQAGRFRFINSIMNSISSQNLFRLGALFRASTYTEYAVETHVKRF
jgi:hypothetical protein